MMLVQGGTGGWGLGAFITIWWLGQLFGFTSSMAQMILVGQVAPKEQRGFWTGAWSSERPEARERHTHDRRALPRPFSPHAPPKHRPLPQRSHR